MVKLPTTKASHIMLNFINVHFVTNYTIFFLYFFLNKNIEEKLKKKKEQT
jgi:hypothetical protein